MRKRSAAVILPVLQADLRRTWSFPAVVFLFQISLILFERMELGDTIWLDPFPILLTIRSFIAATVLFDHYFNADRAAALAAVPVLRAQVFWSKTALLLASAVLPAVPAWLTGLFLSAPAEAAYLCLDGATAALFGACLGAVCCALSAKRLHAAGLFLLLSGFGPVMCGILEILVAAHSVGAEEMRGSLSVELIQRVPWVDVSFETPVLQRLLLPAVCVLLIPAARYIDLYRAPERSGDPRLFPRLRVMYAGMAALLAGAVVCEMTDDAFDVSTILVCAGVFVGVAALTFSLLCAVLPPIRRAFRPRAIPAFCLALAVCAAAMLAWPLYYAYYVPDPARIAEARIECDSISLRTRDEAQIRQALELMRLCAAEPADAPTGTSTVFLTFITRDGGEIRRSYECANDDAALAEPGSPIARLNRFAVSRPDLTAQVFGTDSLDDLTFVDVETWLSPLQVTPEWTRGLAEAFLEDLRAGSADLICSDGDLPCSVKCAAPYTKLALNDDGTPKLNRHDMYYGISKLDVFASDQEIAARLAAIREKHPKAIASYTVTLNLQPGSASYEYAAPLLRIEEALGEASTLSAG